MRYLIHNEDAFDINSILSLLLPFLGIIIVLAVVGAVILAFLIIALVLAYIAYKHTPSSNSKRWIWVLFSLSILGFIIWKVWGPGQKAKILG